MITYRRYIELEDKSEYDFFMRYSLKCNTEKDLFNIGDFTQLSFGLIKDIQYDLAQGEFTWLKYFEYIEHITDIKIKKIAGMDLISLCQSRKYFLSEIERITEIESAALDYVPDDDEIRAGIESLSSLNIYLQFRSIAQSLNLTIPQTRELKYEEGFVELVTQNMLAEYEKKLIQIRSKNK